MAANDKYHDCRYDVRRICLTKSTSDKSLHDLLEGELPSNTYICLGHFDIMQISALSTKNRSPLEAIQADTQSMPSSADMGSSIVENYNYPLYVLKQYTADSSGTANAFKEFWCISCNFLLVTRFHCDRVDKRETRPFSELLSQRCKEFLPNSENKDAYISLRSGAEGSQAGAELAAVTFYDSLELGDIVGIVKSNSLSTTLKLLKYLYECDVVSDAYTYCGVNCDLLKEGASFEDLPKERLFPLREHVPLHATTRFSVKYALDADMLYERFAKNCPGSKLYFITGTADTIAEWGISTEEELLRVAQSIAHSPEIYTAFQDIITRVGINYEKPANSRKTPFKKAPFSHVIPNYQKAIGRLTGPLKQWQYPIVKLLGTLRTMYENSVMDDLSGLLIPGVSAFLERICYIPPDAWSEVYVKDVSEFLDCWTALTTDISHLESQMVQHPELTPVRYYIPTMILQFEQTLVKEYVEIIQSLDRSAAGDHVAVAPRSFAPILFPSPEDNTNTQCLLDPEHDVEYKGKTPLCIFLSIHRLYQPWEVAHILAHEIPHYCGDVLRNREKRLKHLVNSSAAYLAVFLSAYVAEQDQYEEAIVKEVRQFQKGLARRILDQLSPELRSSGYLRSISDELPSAMFRVGANPKNQELLQNIILQNLSPEEQLQHIYKMCRVNVLDGGVSMYSAFVEHITHYIISLYKECYADLFMLLILDSSFQDYYHCVYAEEFQRYGTSTQGSILEHHTDRMAMVMLVMDHLKPDWSLDAFGETDAWATISWEKAAAWKSVRESPTSLNYRWTRVCSCNDMDVHSLLADEACELEAYLTLCACQLKEQLDVQGTDWKNLKELRAHVKIAKNEHFNWMEMRRVLESYPPHADC